jgi:5-methylcytosine-specific restriction endonuclease McrBC regulatory subunit McrC
MKISVPVNNHFYDSQGYLDSQLPEIFGVKKKQIEAVRKLFSSVYEIKLKDKKNNHIRISSFRNKQFEPDEDRLILKLYSKEKLQQEKEYIVQTGLYAGVLFYKGCKINITTKYGDTFLKRMLNFVNDIYIDNEQFESQKDETENQFLFILAYLFIQSLEKAAVLGLPQQYKYQKDRSHKIRGSVDFNEYLKRDIPFQGRLTSIFKERKYVQDIVDVLFLAVRKLERFFGKEIQSRLLGLNQLLKQNYSGQYVTYATIQKAKTHQSINNPMYSGFKKVLEYAEIILLGKDLLPTNEKQQLETTGYLFDIADLYELYLERLLSKNFPDWFVTGQEELRIYEQQFYKRPMFPDLVMKHRISGKVVVFDAKFKKMEMLNEDLDRTDLHQIHSYSGYYKNNLIASGLIYPLSKEISRESAHSASIYGNGENESAFIVDGIYVSERQTMKELIKNEEYFVERISNIIDKKLNS